MTWNDKILQKWIFQNELTFRRWTDKFCFQGLKEEMNRDMKTNLNDFQNLFRFYQKYHFFFAYIFFLFIIE